MALTIYGLCAFASLACAILLFHGSRRSQSGMLWWSGVCFLLLSTSNLAVVVEHLNGPGVPLWPVRHGLSLAAISALLYGLIFEEP